MPREDLLNVYLNFSPDTKPRVGRLWWNLERREHLFEYDPAYLADYGISISPTTLPPTPDVYATPRMQGVDDPLHGLHGVFADSLPDHWGQRAMRLAFEGIGLARPGVLDKLAYVGDRAVGALSYEPRMEIGGSLPASLKAMELRNAARKILEGNTEEVAPLLFQGAGSLGGMHPKFPVLMTPDGSEIKYGLVDATEGFDHWIIKIPSPESAYMNAVEYAYSRMARAAGIDMPNTLLIHDQEGAPYFASMRFDRHGKDGGHRRHMHSYAGLRQLNFKTALIDYRDMMSYTVWLTDSIEESCELFRRMVFNILAVNQDDHGKNTAYLMDERGEWRLSPAYDLTFTPGGEMGHQTAVAGVSFWILRKQLEEIAIAAGIRQWEKIVTEVDDAIRDWPAFAHDAGVNDDQIERIKVMMDFQRGQLGVRV